MILKQHAAQTFCSLVAITVATLCFSTTLHAAPKIGFNQKIRPILSDKCFQCHGPDAKSREAELRLDIRKGAFAKLADGPVIVPNRPEKSTLIERITSHDEDMKMPPEESGKKLTTKEIALLKQWIKEGANWEEHWSFQPPQKAALPNVSQKNWGKGVIDQFILHRLDQEKLAPSKEAERRTLIRRVTFDLTGLPPTLKEVTNFVNDSITKRIRKSGQSSFEITPLRRTHEPILA